MLGPNGFPPIPGTCGSGLNQVSGKAAGMQIPPSLVKLVKKLPNIVW